MDTMLRIVRKKVIVLIGLSMLLLSGVFVLNSIDIRKQQSTTLDKSNYSPKVEPNKFSTSITNSFFSLPVGKKFVYEAETTDGIERVVIEVESNKKTVMGVTTLVYRDRVYIDDQLVEDTKDYLAQDSNGNVWYFGEEVNNYEDGKLKDNEGTWIAGTDGALPGIWIKANHVVGDSYKQEFYKGVAEDVRNVIAIDQTVNTPQAIYKGCVKMYDWTPLDSSSREYKYYCPEVGGLVLSENLITGKKTMLKQVQTQ